MKYFKTYEAYRLVVNGVGSLMNSLAALKRQNINGRYVDPEILAQGIRNEYEAITGEKYEDEVQMSMDNTIADIIGHFKLDGPEFMAAWDKVVKESVTDAYNNLEKIFGTDQETMDMFQGIEDKGTIKDMIEFIDEFGNEEMLSRYGIKSSAQVKKLAKTIMNESYKGNFTDFKYDLEMAIDNMDISPKAIKSVKKKGKGYEVRLSSYMSDKSTWENIGDTIGATLISFKPGSINIGIYE